MEQHSEFLIDFNQDSIINLIANDNYIVVNRLLIKEIGLKEAILLGELASEFNYYQKNDLLDEDGYFYSTIENVKENTTLSSYEQKKCLDKLSERRIVSVVLKGIPAKRHIKINSMQLISLFSNCLKPSFLKNRKLVSEKLTTNNNKEKNNKEEYKEIYKERFKKPTVEEVSLYCKERNNGINAEAFVNFYESKGWLVGKTPMKDWKAAVRTWELKRATKEVVVKDLPGWFNQEQDIKVMSKEEEEQIRKEFDDLLKT